MRPSWNVVLGYPRSGTTFLMHVLNAVSYSECISGQIFPVPIFHIINHPLSSEIYDALAYAFDSSLDSYVENVANWRFWVIYKWLRGDMGTQELVQALKRKRNVKYFVFKEPFLAFAPEFTYHALPDCRIIHIYRDGRDCADSLVRTYNFFTDEKLSTLHTPEVTMGRKHGDHYVPWWVKEGSEEDFLACTPYVRSIWMWKEMVQFCHEFFSRPDVIASGRVMLLRYEDLVQNPLKYGEAVVEHLGAKMTNRIRKRLKLAHTKSIGIHKHRDSREIEEAQRIAKTQLELYGYL